MRDCANVTAADRGQYNGKVVFLCQSLSSTGKRLFTVALQWLQYHAPSNQFLTSCCSLHVVMTRWGCA